MRLFPLNFINPSQGFFPTIVLISGNVSLQNNTINYVDTTAPRTLTLPNPATTTALIMIKDATGSAATNNITVARFGSEEIDGTAASYVINEDFGEVTLGSNGVDWFILSAYLVGSGDVTGGGTGVANRIARWNTSTAIKSSAVEIDDDGNTRIIGAATSVHEKYQNTATGTTAASDGFWVGIASDGKAEIRQRENLATEFYTNNTSRAILQAIGRLTVGDTTESVNFFINDATKLMANGTMTVVASSLSDIIQIGSTTAFEVDPSADTNTGLGAGVYAGQGFNLTLIGDKKFNGGIPIGGYPNPISAVGAFGQVNVQTDDTVDGVVGLLCSSGHQGNGATLSDMIGAAFAPSTSADLGSTGSVTNSTGGYFTTYTDLASDVPITTARGGWFKEPYVSGGGTATITNKTAAYIDGTITFVESDGTDTGNIDAFVVNYTYNYNTGAAPVLRGIIPDAFNKVAIFDFANPATITNESGAVGTAARRITTGTGADLLLVKSVCLIYNTTTSRWRVQWWRV